MQAIMAQIGLPGWRFLTDDKKSTIALSTDTLILTTSDYVRWERFLDDLRPALSGLQTIYSPGYFSRVSLRYQDFIERENLGLDGVAWSKLLKPEVLGEAAVPEIEPYVQQATRLLSLKIPDDGGDIVLQHSLGRPAGNVQGPIGYIIDLDFATATKTEVGYVEDALNKLHSHVRDAFRWCISDRLHAALGPDPISDTIG